LNDEFRLARPVISLLSGVLLCLAAATTVSASDLIEDCNHCHGQNGVSTEPTIPTLAGMSEVFLLDTVAIYMDGDRPCVEAEYLAGPDKGSKTDMCKIIDGLSEAQIEESAKYYAGQQYVRAQQDFDAERAARGEKLHNSGCKKCHEDGGSVADDDAGFLAGQWTPYLRQSLEHYSAGTRVMPKKMKPKYEKLSADEIEDLLHYYASLQ